MNHPTDRSAVRTACLTAVLLQLFWIPSGGYAQSPASLTGGVVSGAPGSGVDLSVNFTPGSVGVCTMQFDLTLPTGLSYVSVSPGAAATSAEKTVSASAVPGGIRVLVFGLNTKVLGAGALATVRLNIALGVSPGTIPVAFSSIVASTPEGNPTAVSSANGAVTVTAPPDPFPPVVTITVPSSSGSFTTSTSPIKVAGTASDNVGVTQVTWASNRGGSGTASGTSNWSVDSIALQSGVNVITVTARDAANNAAAAAITITYNAPDTSAPKVSITAPSSSGSFTSTTTPVTISGTASDDVGVTRVTWSNDRGGSGTASGTTSWTASGVALQAGTNVVTVTARDAADNTGSATITITYASGDTKPPTLSNVRSSSVTTTSAVVQWSTDEPADSQVEFGTTTAYGRTSTLSTALVTSHSCTLTGLLPGTRYYFRARSRDAAGNLGLSDGFAFTTVSDGPLAISDVVLYNITAKGATVAWTTNHPADSQVEYGTTTDLTSLTKLNKNLVTSHSQNLIRLTADTQYYFRVRSRNSAGEVAVSEIFRFRTTPSQKTTLSLFSPALVSSDGMSGALDTSEYTGIAVANLSDSDVSLTFTAFDRSGNEISGAEITNPTDRILSPGAQLPILDTQLFGVGVAEQKAIGWIKVDSTSPQVTGFTLLFNGSLSVLDGAPISFTGGTAHIFPEIEDQGFTRIHIANPNENPVTILFDLVQADGSARGSTVRTLGGNGALAEFVTELFPGVEAAATDYLRINSSRGVIPFQMLGKASRYLEGLNALDANQGSTVLYSPQYVVGGPWRSSLSVVNLDTTPGSVTFRLIGDDGSQVGSTRVLPIAGRGKIHVSDQAFFATADKNLVQGYVEVTGSGIKLAGSVVFGDPAKESFASALPLVSSLQTSVVFSQVASNDVYFSGLAILNPHNAPATATLELYSAEGVLEATVTRKIQARQRISVLLTELFPSLVGQNRASGYVRLNADRGVASFALFGTHDLSVLSAVPAQQVP